MGENNYVFLLIFRAARGCLSRVGIVPPKVTITADDPRLRAGKPAPDPFLLAAECLSYRASRWVDFEDSPSGIKAGIAAGAIVVAVWLLPYARAIHEDRSRSVGRILWLRTWRMCAARRSRQTREPV